MKIIDLYIARTVAMSTLLVLLVLLSLFTFVDFVTELNVVGRGNYNIFKAAQYVLLTVPRRITEIMPVTCLLGTTLGLGILANSSELTAIRAAGVSLLRISFSVFKLGVVIYLILLLFSEVISPNTEKWAQSLRANTMTQGDTLLFREGFWTRDNNSFVRVQTVLFRKLLSGLEIFEVKDRRLQKVTQAEFATYTDKNRWMMHNVKRSQFTVGGILTEHLDSEEWQTDFQPELLDFVSIRPDRLAMWDLYRYINYLNSNDQDSTRYELAFWKKVYLPVVIFVMISISIPFIFGPMRSVPIGQRIVVGTLLGISYHVFDQTMAHLGQVYQIEPWFTALLPAIIFMLITVGFMQSVK